MNVSGPRTNLLLVPAARAPPREVGLVDPESRSRLERALDVRDMDTRDTLDTRFMLRDDTPLLVLSGEDVSCNCPQIKVNVIACEC